MRCALALALAPETITRTADTVAAAEAAGQEQPQHQPSLLEQLCKLQLDIILMAICSHSASR